jgi:hypothetical protein
VLYQRHMARMWFVLSGSGSFRGHMADMWLVLGWLGMSLLRMAHSLTCRLLVEPFLLGMPDMLWVRCWVCIDRRSMLYKGLVLGQQ